MDPAPVDATPAVPARLGPYEIGAFLGAGGMGQVYRARDTRLDREVAIKVLPQSMANDPVALGRFHREAKAVAALSHPNIVAIFDFGSDAGMTYAVTELLEGETLRAQLHGGALPWRRACSIAAAVAEALAAAHAKGVVHRDVKPENVFIGRDGRVKILDFGLARHDRVLAPSEHAAAGEHSLPGTIVGSIGYMSPEQVRGDRVEATSDVFALGCVLYEMLAGERPFQRKSTMHTLAAILAEEPAPLQASGTPFPYELERLVAHCLAKSAQDRYQSARDLAFALESIVQRGSTVSAASSARDRALVAVEEDGRAGAGVVAESAPPETRYAKSGDVNIAYQVVGNGPIDLVFVMGWITHLEYFWREPTFARFLRRLASFSRLILFDKRGTGLSDRVPLDQLPTLEQRMDDVRAVMEAVGSQRAALCGISEGGPMCSLFAATYPERTTALVMIGTYAKRIWAPDYPWAPTAEGRQRFFELMQREWGGPVGVAERAPSRASDPAFRDWWATYLRMGASPGAAVALTRMNAEVDVRHVLPTIRVPSLVIHRSGDLCLKVEEGRYVAAQIPGVRYVELPGDDHLPFVGDQDAVLAEIEEFLTGVRHASEPDRLLATVLSLRVVGAPAGESLLRHRPTFQRELEWYRGREVELAAERLVATFDGPARAARCAAAMVAALRRAGVDAAAGLHTGECDVVGAALRGLPLELAGQVAAEASAGEVLVSSTVRDLVAGSGIAFDERGTVALGPHGEWRLYRVIAS
jgi:pimeloyl-ACP methyl ester carboxylesterase